MPARYPPIDRLPPLQVRLSEAEEPASASPRPDAARGGRVRRGAGRRAADAALGGRGPQLEGRLAGLDAFRGLTLLLFAWVLLLPVPLPRLLGDPAAAGGGSENWSGPAAALLAGLRPAAAFAPWGQGVGVLLAGLLLAAALLAAGAAIPLAAARRGRPAASAGRAGFLRAGGGWLGLLLSLPARFLTLLLVAVLVPVLRPETLGSGPAAALSLLGVLGLVPLTLRFGPGVTPAGRWILRAGGLGVCLLVLCLRIDVPETRAAAWAPDPVVLAIAWNGLFAAALWLLTPLANPLAWGLRLAIGLGVSMWIVWLPGVLEAIGHDGRGGEQAWASARIAGFAATAWLNPAWLMGFAFVAAGTVAGDLGVRHLRDLAPPPAGALPREETDAVRWGNGGVVLMAVLLLSAPPVGVAAALLLREPLGASPALATLPAAGVAAGVTLVGVLLARFLMIGKADASGRWTRSLASLAASLLLAAAAAGAASLLLRGLDGPSGSDVTAWQMLRLAPGVAALCLFLAGGLVAVLAGGTALLDRASPALPLKLALPLTGVGRNPLLLYAVLAGPVLVAFGYPLVPVAPVGTGWGSIDAWAALAITETWGSDASPLHGVGYALLKTLLIGLPIALLARLGVVLRA
ncbi:hypothetical protein [Phycisphaera mikurensis]|uniref:Hypothetical membrane protein n=1 Tax=Phycisphaera mikurensis (strain NBRC 102666 / KCTC 22515 / FYK2301M01) TaxID=1142394 RepID=I0IFE1_PHYMF|nr:hypothetical protein [Phycisphaera mikurensis]MBB6440628.1 hypothetical protein [Phycisphaera mikurensis]BAM03979.1 hypothetical membrane protein [Phycisphaera mikurensis NBRC 102666]